MLPKDKKIIVATIKLFATEGVSVATAKIAEEAGVSNGSLFNYFASKQILIDEVYLQIKTEIADSILSDVAEVKTLQKFLFSLWSSYILWAIANPVKYKVVHLLKASQVISPDATNRTEEIFKVANQKIGQGIADGQIVNIPLDYYCDLVSSQLMAAISYLKSQNLRGKALKEHISNSFEIYWNGIIKR
ncbi:MAG: TetR/AcrR family transcriptional regulator [Pseudomonadota bacterium]